MSVNVEPRRRALSKYEQMEQIKQILKEYLEGKISSIHAAEKIDDILHTYPLEAPYAKRARNVIRIKALLNACRDIVFGERLHLNLTYPQSIEGYMYCVEDALLWLNP